MNDTKQLSLEAMERIELAKSEGQAMIAAACSDGQQMVTFASEAAIGSDSDLVIFARAQASSRYELGQTEAMIGYFDVTTYEWFSIKQSFVEFDGLIEELGSEAIAEFPGDRATLNARKREWRSRAVGWVTIRNSITDPNQSTFWRDLQTQFQALGWPDLYAEPKRGWWALGGLPRDSAPREVLLERFRSLVERGLRTLGFNDHSVVVAVWLDFLLERSPHSVGWCTNNLCLASAECCLDLERRTFKPRPEVVEPSESKHEIKRLKSQRAALLSDYKAATRNPSNKRIYESKNACIHKPEFYKWLRGDLPSDSATTINFERFLREKKEPIPKGSVD